MSYPTELNPLAALTPVEIDTELYKLWSEIQSLKERISVYHKQLAATDKAGMPVYTGHSRERGEKALADFRAKLESAQTLAAPYQDEYARRPWNRYFLVQNSNGHVHRGMDCSTCFPQTLYSWLVELADCDEDKMIEEWGEMACTVCFPDAPTNPNYHRPSRRDREAAEARAAEKEAREAKKAAKNLTSDEFFTDCGGWKVTTVAGAKQAFREASALLAGYGYDHQKPKAPAVREASSAVLLARGVTEAELAEIASRAVKRAQKDWS